MSSDLLEQVAFLFVLLDVHDRGRVSRQDACAFFDRQPDPSEHVDGFFGDVSRFSRRADGEIDWPAWVKYWEASLGQLAMPERDLIIMCRAMRKHHSWRWDDGRHLHQPYFYLDNRTSIEDLRINAWRDGRKG